LFLNGFVMRNSVRRWQPLESPFPSHGTVYRISEYLTSRFSHAYSRLGICHRSFLWITFFFFKSNLLFTLIFVLHALKLLKLTKYFQSYCWLKNTHLHLMFTSINLPLDKIFTWDDDGMMVGWWWDDDGLMHTILLFLNICMWDVHLIYFRNIMWDVWIVKLTIICVILRLGGEFHCKYLFYLFLFSYWSTINF
jgi:hypothetical protein